MSVDKHGKNKNLKNSLAQVFLLKEGDLRNICYISKHSLLVVRNGKPTQIDIDLIQSLKISHKRFLLPILAGGTFASFSILVILLQYFDPLISIPIFLMGLFIFYYGYNGSDSLIVMGFQPIKEVFLPSISPNVKAFIDFVNADILRRQDDQMNLFIIINQEMKVILERDNLISFKTPTPIYTRDFFQKIKNTPKSERSYKITVVPSKLSGQIKYLTDRDIGQIGLYYNGDITMDQVQNIESLE